MKNKCFKIYPGMNFGKSVWYVEYEDGTEETIPFDDDVEKILMSKSQNYLMKKRKEKINKILNNIK